jgi:hypothetical protein
VPTNTNALHRKPYSPTIVGHWARASYWTPYEIAAISLAWDPRYIDWTFCRPNTDDALMQVYFSDRCDIVSRAVVAGHLYDKTIPSVAIAWMERLRFGFSPELKDAVYRLGIPVADWQTLFESSTARADALEAELNETQNQHFLTIEDLETLHAEYQQLHNEAVGACQYLEQEIADRDRRITVLEAQLEEANEALKSSKLGALTRKNTTLSKLVFAMGRGGYGAKGRVPDTEFVQAVLKDCEEAGVALDLKTTRSHLTDSSERYWDASLEE